MDDKDINQICDWVNKGAKLFIGRDPSGRSKVKIVRGPLGLFTRRFQCEDSQVSALRKKLVVTAPRLS